MNKAQQELTFDCLPNMVDIVESNESVSVLEEIARCRDLYDQRQASKRKKAMDIKPLYYEHMKRRDLVAKYPIYKFLCVYPKPSTKYDPCHHIGGIILDRDILTKDEHINFLAQPKLSLAGFTKPPRCIYQRRFLPNCTTRINSLSHPKARYVQHNWQDFRHLLSVRQVANLRKTLQRPPIEYTSIENAITFVHEERRLKSEMKNEALKRCDRIKRKLLKMERQNISKIVRALYEVMKEFLINDQFVSDTGEENSLCRALESKIVQFCGLENTSTSHVRHLIKTVAQNLAIWIEKFTFNCGFRNAPVPREKHQIWEPNKPAGEQEILLPVDDFIPYHSPSISVAAEDYIDAEEFDELGEYEDDVN